MVDTFKVGQLIGDIKIKQAAAAAFGQAFGVNFLFIDDIAHDGIAAAGFIIVIFVLLSPGFFGIVAAALYGQQVIFINFGDDYFHFGHIDNLHFYVFSA